MKNSIDDPTSEVVDGKITSRALASLAKLKNFVDSIHWLNREMEYFFYDPADGFVSFGNIAFHLALLF